MASIQCKSCILVLVVVLNWDSCMILLGSKICCSESSEAPVQINILAPSYSTRGVPGTSDV